MKSEGKEEAVTNKQTNRVLLSNNKSGIFFVQCHSVVLMALSLSLEGS
jgi:hypothetical protein